MEYVVDFVQIQPFDDPLLVEVLKAMRMPGGEKISEEAWKSLDDIVFQTGGADSLLALVVGVWMRGCVYAILILSFKMAWVKGERVSECECLCVQVCVCAGICACWWLREKEKTCLAGED